MARRHVDGCVEMNFSLNQQDLLQKHSCTIYYKQYSTTRYMHLCMCRGMLSLQQMYS